MNRRVNHEGCCVQQSDLPTIDNLAVMVDVQQIRGLDLRERDSERIDPKVVLLDRITDSDVSLTKSKGSTLKMEKAKGGKERLMLCTCNSLVISVLPKDAESSSKAPLEIFAFLERV